MFCRFCGTNNSDNAVKCIKCGSAMQQPVMPQQQQAYAPGQQPYMPGQAVKIPNHLTDAIATTLCCCLPFGVVAIIYAAQVNPKLAQGDAQGAMYASKNAKMWAWIAFGAGALIAIISAVLRMAEHSGLRH